MTRSVAAIVLGLVPLAMAACAEGTMPSSETSSTADALRIIRGEPVEAGKYPWMIYANGCSASLISSSYVLMAAHCFGDQRNDDGTLEGVVVTSAPVGFGHPELESPQMTTHEVAAVHLHPGYLPLTEEETWGLEPYDVALLELTDPILLPQYIRLPTRDPVPDEALIAAGWGLTARGPTTILQETELVVADDGDCYHADDELRFCTLGNETNSNIGSGDSGGPVFVLDGDGFMVLGTNSTSNGDSRQPIASHAQTYTFVPWILEVAGAEFACTGEGVDRVCMADVDECMLDLDNCGVHGECENTVEGYTCACDPGFEFDGDTCVEESVEDSSEDSSAEDSSPEDSSAEDSSAEDSSAEDSSAEDSSAEDSSGDDPSADAPPSEGCGGGCSAAGDGPWHGGFLAVAGVIGLSRRRRVLRATETGATSPRAGRRSRGHADRRTKGLVMR